MLLAVTTMNYWCFQSVCKLVNENCSRSVKHQGKPTKGVFIFLEEGVGRKNSAEGHFLLAQKGRISINLTQQRGGLL